jgi:hypothetical protein
MKRTQRLLVLATLTVAAGCYHYVPAVSTASPQGTPVRVSLDTLSAFELSQITVNNIQRVEGEVVRVDASELILSASWLVAITENGYPGNGWTVHIPESNVTTFEQRKLSWWRTGVVVAGAVVGTWLGFDALGIGPSFGGGGSGTGNTQ